MTRCDRAIQNMNHFLAEYEQETDDAQKAFLMSKAVYWSIEADLEKMWENIDWEQVARRFGNGMS